MSDKPYTCCGCGNPTSLGPHATVRGVHRSACAKCYDTKPYDFQLIELKDADSALLKAALEGTPADSAQERGLVHEELEKRKAVV